MTRTHAARQLLALGPLSFGQFATVTGWPVSTCRRVLSYLVDDTGEVSREAGIYRIEDGKELRDVPALEPQEKPADGAAQIRPLRPWASVGVSAAIADVREAQAGCCGRCSGSGCLAGEGVNTELKGRHEKN